jgi:poly(A) polymerase
VITVDHPTAGLWFLRRHRSRRPVPPRAPGDAPRARSDPPPQGRAHAHVRGDRERPTAHEQPPERPPFDFRLTRLAALFHDIGKPRTRGLPAGQGHHVPPSRRRRCADDPRGLEALRYSNDDVAAVTELVALHLRFHTYRFGWSDSAVRRYVRDAGPLLNELNVLTRCDCTTRNERKARTLSSDGRARGAHRGARRRGGAGLDPARARRTSGDGASRGAARSVVGDALDALLEIRLDEGPIGEDEARQRLLAWWAERQR